MPHSRLYLEVLGDPMKNADATDCCTPGFGHYTDQNTPFKGENNGTFPE